VPLHRHPDAGEQEPARGHFEDDGVEPVHEEDFVVGTLAMNVDSLQRLHGIEIGGQGAERQASVGDALARRLRPLL
jgi:hypothetical protein